MTSTTKADAVLIEVRRQLIGGRWGYGEILSSADLAAEFGVSRRPVMDALISLETAGFIEIIRQVGCKVVVPTRRSLREHFYAAAVLEGAAAGLAAANATPGERREVEQALHASATSAAAEDVTGFQLANKQFHTATLSAGGNRKLSDLGHAAWNLSDFFLQKRPPTDLRRSHAEHQQVAAFILDGDSAAARNAMEAHLARFGEEAFVPDTEPDT